MILKDTALFIGKERDISWINVSKAICMLLVFAYHTGVYLDYNSPLYHFYAPFFTNTFFFVSGYLIFRKQLAQGVIDIPVKSWAGRSGGGRKMLSSIVNKIVFPTIFFSLINFLLKTLLRSKGFQVWDLISDTILGGSLWFTCALAVAELIVFAILLSRKRSIWFYLTLSLIIAFVGIMIAHAGISIKGNTSIPWYYKTGMIATLFISVGGLFGKYEKQVDSILCKYHNVPAWGVAFIYVLLAMTVPLPIKTAINTCSLNLLGLGLSGISIIAMVYLCKLIPSQRSIQWLGRHTLGMYFLSGGIPNIIAIVVNRFGVNMNYMLFLALSIFAYVLAAIGVWILDKHIPFVFDTRKLISHRV